MEKEVGTEKRVDEKKAAAKILVKAVAAIMGDVQYEGVKIVDFLEAFAKLVASNPKLIQDLIAAGKFASTRHSIHEMNCVRGQPHHECDDCYSGDTEYEHDAEILQLKEVLKEAYKRSCPGFEERTAKKDEDDGEESEDAASEE